MQVRSSAAAPPRHCAAWGSRGRGLQGRDGASPAEGAGPPIWGGRPPRFARGRPRRHLYPLPLRALSRQGPALPARAAWPGRCQPRRWAGSGLGRADAGCRGQRQSGTAPESSPEPARWGCRTGPGGRHGPRGRHPGCAVVTGTCFPGEVCIRVPCYSVPLENTGCDRARWPGAQQPWPGAPVAPAPQAPRAHIRCSHEARRHAAVVTGAPAARAAPKMMTSPARTSPPPSAQPRPRGVTPLRFSSTNDGGSGQASPARPGRTRGPRSRAVRRFHRPSRRGSVLG